MMASTEQDTRALVVHGEDAEVVGLPHGGAFRLLADAGATRGALGVNSLTLGVGADGARPHRHMLSTELFYVVGGKAVFYVGGDVVTVEAGGLVVVPPGTPHAFGAAEGSTAEVLAVLTPGVERFEYFRRLGRIGGGQGSFDSLLPDQERFDVHFLDLPHWRSP
ncbi:cupin domain-containing protein [Nonomuraea mangrovi]|uniref:Cupin domain-containing protein n=2 Tax=Nonomuraea TaxID=83681 RepID=A0ABW4SSK9_9ACTN